jgi:hypothetical protein
MALTVRLTDDGDSIGEMRGAWAYECDTGFHMSFHFESAEDGRRFTARWA